MDQIISFGATTLTQECRHIRPSLLMAVSFCSCVATSFVLSLYALLPAKVRQLDRDDPSQIKWRTFATGFVCLGAIIAYPFYFCAGKDTHADSNYYYENGNQSVLERVGLIVPGLPLWNHFGALAHATVLYIGPIMLIFVQAKVISAQSARTPKMTYLQALRSILFPSPRFIPTEDQQTAERWITARNKVIAPVLEEVAFRGCMVPVLMATGLFHPVTVALVAPVFFGLAHVHHAVLKVQQGEPITRVLLTTTFQFLYTSLFGAYAAHAFLRSRSLTTVMLSHSFCNAMGLPSLYFLNNKTSPLYRYRFILMKAHFLGIAIFTWGFTTTTFLP